MRTQESRNISNSGWTLSTGIIMLVLGMIAVISPWFLASIAVVLMFAWLLIIAGIAQAVHAFKSSSAGGILLKLLLSIISLLAGIVLLIYPLAGMVSLTLVLGIFIFLDGVLRVIQAFQLRPMPKWGWILFNGILSIILGILIWSQWPFDALWILGLFMGISLILNGVEVITFATSAREHLSEPTHES
ncbi:DUF308 domain-containing protein [Pleurocapsales cyanobacterium LEGE 10410]|nr:DUF308 domain-containing protein [Pleurocapsales cyanobacterium LEGE 10410]